ncbi:MAG TPA: SRPBCC family protein [Alphaproteobacteria bacterium]|nr:SRPBCC family protein [Alphaproteobacteria bacterium]
MENSIHKRIEIKAPVSRVWKALTDYREFGAWFGVKVDAPFVVGKPATGEKTSGGCDGKPWNAVIVKMEPERLFSYTWHPWSSGELSPGEKPNLVEFVLEPTKIGTLLKVTETGFASLPQARYDESFPKHTEGWTKQVENVANHIAQNP